METLGQRLQIGKMMKKMKRKMKKKIRKDFIRSLHQSLDLPPSSIEFHVSLKSEKRVSPLPVVEKTVYIRVGRETYYSMEEMDWYVFKFSSNDSCSSSSSSGGKGRRQRGEGAMAEIIMKIEPISKETETPWFSCFVALGGSTIYCIGSTGCYPYSLPKVIAADAYAVGGKQVTRMKANRRGAQAVTADNKIYVFGGILTEDCNKGWPEIEVFDPIKKTWESFEHPPPSFNFDFREFFVIYDDASKRIILGSYRSGVLLGYNVTREGVSEEDPWKVLDTGFKFPQPIPLSQPALFGNALCWICTENGGVVLLFLYDMDLKMSALAPILGFGHLFCDVWNVPVLYSPPFFHFRGGNEFYFIWLDFASGPKVESLIRCTRILVSKRFDMKKQRIRMKAYALSTKTYLLHEQVRVLDAVVL